MRTAGHDWKQTPLVACRVHLSSANSDQQLSQFGHVQRCVDKDAPSGLASSSDGVLSTKCLSGTRPVPHSRGRPTDGCRWPCLPSVNQWQPMDTRRPDARLLAASLSGQFLSQDVEVPCLTTGQQLCVRDNHGTPAALDCIPSRSTRNACLILSNVSRKLLVQRGAYRVHIFRPPLFPRLFLDSL